MQLNDLIKSGEKEFLESGKVISDSTEKSLTEFALELKDKIDSGEANKMSQNELVDAYVKLAAPTINSKKEKALKVKLVKTPKRLLITMLNTAITTTFSKEIKERRKADKT